MTSIPIASNTTSATTISCGMRTAVKPTCLCSESRRGGGGAELRAAGR